IRDATVTGVQTCALPIWPHIAAELAASLLRARRGLHRSHTSEKHMKLTILAGTLALTVLLSAGVAAANDVQGRVKAIEMTQKVITLDNGTKLFWTDDIHIADQLQSRDLVKARYVERGGRLVLTEIEIVV